MKGKIGDIEGDENAPSLPSKKKRLDSEKNSDDKMKKKKKSDKKIDNAPSLPSKKILDSEKNSDNKMMGKKSDSDKKIISHDFNGFTRLNPYERYVATPQIQALKEGQDLKEGVHHLMIKPHQYKKLKNSKFDWARKFDLWYGEYKALMSTDWQDVCFITVEGEEASMFGNFLRISSTLKLHEQFKDRDGKWKFVLEKFQPLYSYFFKEEENWRKSLDPNWFTYIRGKFVSFLKQTLRALFTVIEEIKGKNLEIRAESILICKDDKVKLLPFPLRESCRNMGIDLDEIRKLFSDIIAFPFLDRKSNPLEQFELGYELKFSLTRLDNKLLDYVDLSFLLGVPLIWTSLESYKVIDKLNEWTSRLYDLEKNCDDLKELNLCVNYSFKNRGIMDWQRDAKSDPVLQQIFCRNLYDSFLDIVRFCANVHEHYNDPEYAAQVKRKHRFRSSALDPLDRIEIQEKIEKAFPYLNGVLYEAVLQFATNKFLHNKILLRIGRQALFSDI